MSLSLSLDLVAEVVVAALLLFSGVAVLVAGLGLWRLPEFFERLHAPALAYTLASWAVTLGSIIHFSAREGHLAPHVWLIIILLSITAPITTLLLARAAMFRQRGEAGDDMPAPLAGEKAAEAEPTAER